MRVTRRYPDLLSEVCCQSCQDHPATSEKGLRQTVVSEETTELILPSRIEAIAEASAAAATIARRLSLDDEAAFAIDMAVRESVTNAILHGNQQDESKIVEIRFRETLAALEITVRDQGEGFDPFSVPDPTDPQNLMKASGRGILFMRNFMDEVEWSRHPEGGTVVRMTKRRATPTLN